MKYNFHDILKEILKYCLLIHYIKQKKYFICPANIQQVVQTTTNKRPKIWHIL